MGKMWIPAGAGFCSLAFMFLMAVTAEALTLRAYNGDVIFDHAAHKKMFACKDCHEGGPRHMGLDKASAHKLCLGCHTAQKAGPVKHCSDCHKKA